MLVATGPLSTKVKTPPSHKTRGWGTQTLEPRIQNLTERCVELPEGTRLGLDEHLVFHAKVARGGREDCLRANEDFFAARHRAADVVFADKGGNLDSGLRWRFGFWQRSCIAPAFGRVCA